MFNEIRNETLLACIFHALLLRKGVAEGTWGVILTYFFFVSFVKWLKTPINFVKEENNVIFFKMNLT